MKAQPLDITETLWRNLLRRTEQRGLLNPNFREADNKQIMYVTANLPYSVTRNLQQQQPRITRPAVEHEKRSDGYAQFSIHGNQGSTMYRELLLFHSRTS